MAAAPSPTALAVVRQVRRVRWRRNLLALQRALYLAAAALIAGAAAAVPLALADGIGTFVAGMLVAASAVFGVLAVAARRTWRDWLGQARASVWIDEAAGLEGRLVTLAALERARDERRSPDGFLIPLLETQNAERLPLWRPERLLPGDVPVGAACAALASVAALLLVLTLVRRLEPPGGDLLTVDAPLAAMSDPDGLFRRSDGLVVAASGTEGGMPDPASPSATGAEESSLTRLARDLQDRVRERVWGERWARLREALARAHRAEGEARAGSSDARGGVARSARDAAGAMSGDGDPVGDAADARPGAEEDATDPRRLPGAAGDPGAVGQAAGGAGTGTEPQLYGEATAPDAAAADTFELAIAARVRTLRLGPRPPDGPAPAAAPDARPALAPRQRREAALHRAVVPPAWEAVVREVFAHRAPEPVP